MKPKNTHLAALTFASLIGSAALSQATVLWQLDFNSYADGTVLTTGNPAVGPGFPGNWFAGSGTVTVTGGVAQGSGSVHADLGNTFSATVGSTGTLWVSFDWGHDTSTASTFGGLTFFNHVWDGGSVFSEKGLIGNTWDQANWSLNQGDMSSADGIQTSISSIGMKTGVVRITLGGSGNSIIDLWVAATGSPVDVSGTPMATSTGLNFSEANNIRIMGGNDQKFDNLIIGTTMASVGAIPEPSAALLGGLGLLCLLRRRRA